MDETQQTTRYTRPGRVDSEPEKEGGSAMHKDTVARLNEFSSRLRALKSPGVKKSSGLDLLLFKIVYLIGKILVKPHFYYFCCFCNLFISINMFLIRLFGLYLSIVQCMVIIKDHERDY